MGALTFRGAGAVVSSSDGSALNPTVTHSDGDLLILHTGQRSGGESVAAITGWTQLGALTSNGSLEVWARIADGGANDAPSVDWSGSSFCEAWIEAWYGDVHTDLGTIVAALNTFGSSSRDTLTVPSLTVPQDGCLIIASCRKNKTGASNDNTFTAPANFTERNEYLHTGVSANVHASCSWMQTTTQNVSQADWTRTGTAEALAVNAIIVALKTATTVASLKLLADAAAAGATDIEGVVLNAARDTVIGEFSGQAFEAALEGGEAVLLIPVSEITPDGSTLTTSDTPLVAAYNSTHGTVGLGSATVIEE